MATQVVTQLIVDASGAQQGVAAYEAAMARAKKAAVDAGTTTATSFERAQQRWTQSLGATDPVIRAQIAMERDLAKQRAINTDVVRLGIATQEAANSQLDKVRQKHLDLAKAAEQAAFNQTAVGKTLGGVSGQLIALSAGAGPVGVFLSALGPWGVAAAVGLGGVNAALNAISAGAHELAQKSIELQKFADTTGLSTAQVQALRSEASKFNLTGDEVETVIRQFTARFNELRLGQGELLTQVRRVNPALADQMASATDAASALTLLGRALSNVDDVFQRNALVKAAGGRGGLQTAKFLTGIDVNAITQGYVDAGKALDDNLINKLAKLEIESAKAAAHAKQNINSIFGEAAVQWERDWNIAFDKFTSALTEKVKDKGFTQKAGAWMMSQIIGAIGSVSPTIGAEVARYGTPAKPPWWATTDTPSRLPSVGTDWRDSVRGMFPAQGQAQTPEYLVSKQKELIAILGAAATPAEQLKLKLAELAIAAKTAGVSDDVLRRAQAALNEEFNVSRIAAMVSALGSAATISEQYRLHVAQLHQQLDQGKVSQDTFNRAIEGLKVDEKLRGMRDTIAALGDLATPTQQYELRVAELKQQLDQGRISQETFNTAVMGANPLFKLAKDSAQQFTDSLVQGLLSGKSLADSLRGALKSLSSSLATGAVKSLFQGDFVMAAIQGVGAIVTGFLGQQSEAAKKAQEAAQKAKDEWEGMQAQVQKFSDTLAGIKTSALVDNLQQLFEQLQQISKAAFAAQGQSAVTDLQRQFTVMEARVFDEFKNGAPVLGEAATAIKNAKDEAAALRLEMGRLGFSAAQTADVVDAGLTRMVKDIGDKFTNNVTREINEALGKGFINDLTDLKNQIADLRGVVGDSLLDTLLGVKVQKIVDDAGLLHDQLGDVFNIFPQLTGVIHESTKGIQDQIAAQQKLNDTAKGIVDYVNGLLGGQNSQLSPIARLNASRDQYNTTLGLAQGGNADAQGRITSDFEAYRLAAKAMFGSSSAYQDIVKTGMNQLLALPAVQKTTDPLVQALRDSAQRQIDAINAATAAIGGTTMAVGGTTAAVIASSNAIAQTTAGSVQALIDGMRAGNVVQPSFGPSAANEGRVLSPISISPMFDSAAPGEGRLIHAAAGAMVPPYTSYIGGEHGPHPFAGRTGPEPLFITPNVPGNDNGRVASSVDRLTATVDAQTKQITQLLARIAQLEERGNDRLDDIHEQGEDWRRDDKRRAQQVNGPKGRAAA
jgi:hypothetical protein